MDNVNPRRKDRSLKGIIVRYVSSLGAWIMGGVSGLGKYTNFMARVGYWSFRGPFRKRLIWEQLFLIGNKSLFIVCLTGAFAGMVLAYQTFFGFKVISADALVGPIVSLGLAKELAPVLTGLVVAGRCGAAMAAQIGTMRVTEQIDALEVMGISSHQYLAVPRIIATTMALPLLSILFLFVGSAGAWVISIQILGIEQSLYLSKLGEFMDMGDIYQGIIKAFVFGFLIACIGTYHGFSVKGGAEGVGRGTNLAVVWGMVVVLVIDYFLTSFLIRIL